MKKYVVGFAFNPKKTQVVLIKKNKPDWQRGKLNGVGGKVEKMIPETELQRAHIETPHQAMVREFQEETGALLLKWHRFAVLTFGKEEQPDAILHCFRIFTEEISVCKTMEEEEIGFYDPKMIIASSGLCIENLKVLIPMAMDEDFQFADISAVVR